MSATRPSLPLTAAFLTLAALLVTAAFSPIVGAAAAMLA